MIFSTKKSALILGLILLSSQLFAQREVRIAYINKYKDIAISQMHSHGIPASIILAQACLESANGTSRLATEANNHFGIKCHNWEGGIFLHDDDEKNECFRVYSSPEESFRDHSEFLLTRPRYAFLFDIDSGNYKAWAHGLKAAGYATNPRYAHLLIQIIEDYSLYEYDKKEAPADIAITAEDEENLYKQPVPTPEQPLTISLTRELFSVNGVKYVISQKGESYSSIASQYNLFTKELLRYNDLNDEEPLPEGRRVFVERKKRRAERGVSSHISNGNESLKEISDIYGVRHSRIQQLNRGLKTEIPEKGSTIRVR